MAALLPDEPAYITGVVIARDGRLDGQRSALVATDPRDPTTRSAHVLLEGDITVVWRSGHAATVADVLPGRVVTAWVGPSELRSLPPVVPGRIVVLER